MTDIIIRELDYCDLSNGFLESLDSLKTASTLTDSQRLEIFKKIQNSSSQIIYVILKDSKVIGSATLLIEQKFIHDGKCVGHIEDVVIKKEFQKTNFGTLLIKDVLKRSESEGCYKTVLNCLEKISPFYIKLGFVPHLTGMRYNHSKN
mgnify:CR=1 FL=1|jgi:glucosamine-phosphate N-acetyltransferase